MSLVELEVHEAVLSLAARASIRVPLRGDASATPNDEPIESFKTPVAEMNLGLVSVRAHEKINAVLLGQVTPIPSLELVWREMCNNNLPVGGRLVETLLQPSRLRIP
jgi:hypothetical protein